MASSKTFLDAIKDRRSYYQLNKESPKSDKEIVELVNQLVLNVPSSFNSQSSRLVVLLNQEHEKFWEITKDVLKPQVPEEQYKSGTEPKLNGFKAAYGTVSAIHCLDASQGATRSMEASRIMVWWRSTILQPRRHLGH